MAAANPIDTYTILPLTVSDKSVTASTSLPADVSHELASLNALHALLHAPEIPEGIPPPPMPLNPKRSAQIDKLKNSGNIQFRTQNFPEAIKLYTLALQMALQRPPWEPSHLMRDQLQLLYSNRSQAHMGIGNWPEALADADASVFFKKVGNPKAHWRKGKCLREMGRLEEAKDALEFGLEFGSDADLTLMLKEVEEALARRV
ncbi:hypothetical protein RUND412_000125 [Rhizina undulata]